MSEIERFDVLVFGSGAGGKITAWTSASEGLRTAVVERGLIGGSCPNIACLPTRTSSIAQKSPTSSVMTAISVAALHRRRLKWLK
jgi:pyruvate/2-oxoglutarate dehydrogenase complex dihydrolipoamide dehydrogenase (E3) component